MRSAVLCCVVLGFVAALPMEDFTNFLETASMSGMNVSAISINGGVLESKLTLGDADSAFVLAMQQDGSFAIRHNNQPTFVVDPSGAVSVAGTLQSKGAIRITGTMNYMGIQQWFLAAVENFNAGAVGWSNSSTTTCGNTNKMILGGCGKFAGGEVNKVFRNLPAHNMVRMRANFHFIDKWVARRATLSSKTALCGRIRSIKCRQRPVSHCAVVLPPRASSPSLSTLCYRIPIPR